MTTDDPNYLQTIRDIVLTEAATRDSLTEARFLAIEAIKSLDYETLHQHRMAHLNGPPTLTTIDASGGLSPLAEDTLLFTAYTPGDSLNTYPDRDDNQRAIADGAEELARAGHLEKHIQYIGTPEDGALETIRTYRLTETGRNLARLLRLRRANATPNPVQSLT
jgi:hypothetical protein